MEKLYLGRGNDADRKKLLDFLDEVFFNKEDEDFLSLLPKIYKEKYRPAHNNIVLQEQNGRFRAAVGNYYNDMLVGGEKLKTCCIGNVAVGKEFRSMGYMSKLLELSVDDMKKNGTDFSYLGGQRQRYGYFGYESAGTVYDFTFTDSSYKNSLKNIAGGFSMEPLEKTDTEALAVIDSIYSKGSVISLRPMDAYFDILQSWKHPPFIFKDGEKIVGYAVFNKKLDNLKEFGLTDYSLFPRFIASLFENTDNKSFSLTVAPYETEKLDFLSRFGSQITVNSCESVLVLNWEKTIRAFMKAQAAYTRLGDGSFTVLIHGKAGDEALRISVENNRVEVCKTNGATQTELSCHEATRAFFSIYPNDRRLFPPEARQWLPLPMFISSVDSM